jgi:ATP-dependent Clp protease adaptor protein ClpS
MSTNPDVIEEQKVELKVPKKWAIVLHNDDLTPMEFVVSLLLIVFNMSNEMATAITLKVHTDGSGVAGLFSYEVAEQKLSEAHTVIKLSSMPLRVTMKEE